MWHNVCNEQLKTNEPVLEEKKKVGNVKKNHEKMYIIRALPFTFWRDHLGFLEPYFLH